LNISRTTLRNNRVPNRQIEKLIVEFEKCKTIDNMHSGQCILMNKKVGVYYGKYFFVYALDYESAVSINKESLSEAEKKTHINTIINLRRWSRYGQYQVQIVSTKLNKQLFKYL
jgi:hypothetical protein